MRTQTVKEEMMLEYVINLSTVPEGSSGNDYGYWAGKTYKHGDETFPFGIVK
jgi:hypothetical protein